MDDDTSVRQIAAHLLSAKRTDDTGATVILGAGASVASGIPLWPDLAKRACKDFHIATGQREPMQALAKFFDNPTTTYHQRYDIFHKYISNKKPSIGYSHLAQLVKEGLISTILTTNWDPLAEMALQRAIPVDLLKVLTRGEINDSSIAEILEWRRGNQPTVVKLHGDTQSRKFFLGAEETRTFGEPLGRCLTERMCRTTFVVGQSAQDIDILSLLLNAHHRRGPLYYIKYSESESAIDKIMDRAGAKTIQGPRASVLSDGTTIDAIGDFDSFFTQLNLAVQHAQTELRRTQLRKAELSILNKEKTGVGYINYTRITSLVDSFVLQVAASEPDLILFIDDPSAAGGMELKRRMTPVMRDKKLNIPVGTIRIEGKRGSRTHERGVTSIIQNLPMDKVKKVLILDAITFSGNTLNIARNALQKEFPLVQIRLGVLVISHQLAQRVNEDIADRSREEYLSQVETDRYEIFFPWGVTQTTGHFDRIFEGATEEGKRHVSIAKRPWGTIEVLADDEITSVRLLTIEASRKLSFQRHFCRDELFVALDDNIGLDICTEELDRNADEYHESVRSLILEKGDYVLVPRGVWHRTKASMDRVRLLEVSFGLYDQNADIERRWDDYERQDCDGRI